MPRVSGSMSGSESAAGHCSGDAPESVSARLATPDRSRGCRCAGSFLPFSCGSHFDASRSGPAAVARRVAGL